jgi:thioredoxin-like negative regulator of GroEL
MAPVVDRLEAEFAGQAQVVRLNAAVPAEEALAKSYDLQNHPTFAVVDAQGRATLRLFGIQPIEQLRAGLQAVIDQ